MILIDPDDPEIAVDSDGTLMGAVRMVPWDGDGTPPSFADLRAKGTIIGYCRPDALHFERDDPEDPDDEILRGS
jgi:hypothetical protein